MSCGHASNAAYSRTAHFEVRFYLHKFHSLHQILNVTGLLKEFASIFEIREDFADFVWRQRFRRSKGRLRASVVVLASNAKQPVVVEEESLAPPSPRARASTL